MGLKAIPVGSGRPGARNNGNGMTPFPAWGLPAGGGVLGELLGLRAERVEFGRRELIYGMGDPASGVYAVQSGRVRSFRLSLDGREITLWMDGPGGIFGEEALFSREARSTFAESLERSIAAFIPREVVLARMYQRPKLSAELFRITGERLLAAQRQVESLAFRGVTSRVAELVLELAERQATAGKNEVVLQPGLTHQQMASLVGTTRETFTSTLSKLGAMNVLKSRRRRLHVLDMDALREFC